MREYKSESRVNKIKEVLKKRQPDLSVILENIHDPHNVNAILRSCDSVGVSKLALLYFIERFPKLSRNSSASSSKWIDLEYYDSPTICISQLKNEGYKILGSKVAPEAKTIHQIDFTQKVAVLFGNEHRGISEETEKLCDELFYIPMYGMAQSLNVSVATAVTLYEALRQRQLAGMYDKIQYNEQEYETLIDQWCHRNDERIPKNKED